MAIRAAVTSRGVAVVVVPGEVFLQPAEGDTSPISVRQTSSVVCPDGASLAAATEVLNSARSVTILAGAGCQGAHEEVVTLAGALKAPIVHSFAVRNSWSTTTLMTWA